MNSKEYQKQYRRDGYGRLADSRYRLKHREQIIERDRERKRAKTK